MDAVFDNFDLVLRAFGYTFCLFLVSGVLLPGARHAAGRHAGRSGRACCAGPAATYVTLVRNTPLLIIFIFFRLAAPEARASSSTGSTSTSATSTSPRSSAPPSPR